jgi:hypothetical protein
VKNTDETINKLITRISMATPAMFVSCLDSQGEGAMTSARGSYYEIVGLMAVGICRFSKESNTDLNDLKYDIDEAIEIIKKGMEE